jgi:hypothetical protein
LSTSSAWKRSVGGERDPERLGGLEVDDQLEFHGLFHWEIARLVALQDLIHVVRRAPKHVREITWHDPVLETTPLMSC